MRMICWLAIVLPLVGCAATLPSAPALTSVPRPAVPQARIPETPVTPTAAVVWNIPRTVQEALQDSLQQPEPWRFQGGVLVYQLVPGARYLVPVAMKRLTTLRFAPGEVLQPVMSGLPKCADGDMEQAKTQEELESVLECLTIQEMKSGDGATQQWHVSLVAGKPGLKTNMLITTSHHAYDVEVVTSTSRYAPVVQWNVPAPLIAKESIPQEVIGLGYTATSRRGDQPAWTPRRIWDDLHHTYLQFPPQTGSHELPLIYAVTMEGTDYLINSRTYQESEGPLMVVDGIFDGLTLRVGKDPDAQLVDIRRTEGYRYIHCPGATDCPTQTQMVGR